MQSKKERYEKFFKKFMVIWSFVVVIGVSIALYLWRAPVVWIYQNGQPVYVNATTIIVAMAFIAWLIGVLIIMILDPDPPDPLG